MTDINNSVLDTKDPVEKAAELLRELAVAQKMVQGYTDEANTKIDSIKNDLAVTCRLYTDKIETLQSDLQSIADEHKDMLFPVDPKKDKKKRSLLLKFGEFGFKKTTSIDIPVEALTVQKIEKDQNELAVQTGLNLALTREPKINKKMLSGYADDLLKLFGINRETKEVFFFEVNTSNVESGLPQVSK